MEVGTHSSSMITRRRRRLPLSLPRLPAPALLAALLLLLLAASSTNNVAEAFWCVARSDASDDALMSGLEYACSQGADCAPIQSEAGLCYLPNTVVAHASYAYNSFYQRKRMAPGSCDFAGTATLAQTDPSYGSCVYPPNPSTAGGLTSTTPASNVTTSTSPYGTLTPTATPTTTGVGSGNNYGLTPSVGSSNYTIPTTTSGGGGGGGSARFPHVAAAFCSLAPLIASFW